MSDVALKSVSLTDQEFEAQMKDVIQSDNKGGAPLEAAANVDVIQICVDAQGRVEQELFTAILRARALGQKPPTGTPEHNLLKSFDGLRADISTFLRNVALISKR